MDIQLLEAMMFGMTGEAKSDGRYSRQELWLWTTIG